MTTVTIRAGIDAYADSAHTAQNFGTAKALSVGSGTSTQYAYVFLNPKIPAKATVLSATLRVYTKGAWGASAATLTVQRIAASWKSSQINYTNRPTVTGATATATVPTNSVDGTLVTFDVTSIMQTIAGGASNYGLRISSNLTVSHALYSLESGNLRPELDVTWSDAPDKPSQLAPGTGQAVGLPSPWLRFDYTDVSGSTQLQAVQVQVDPAANWTTPAFDSGTVTTPNPELNLANTAYPGLAAGATTQWRVRVQDAAGLWSSWSDAHSFTYTTKGTLTLTAPAAGTVNDFTPPITWTFTGRTQSAYRITVAEDATPGKLKYDSGKIASTATALTLPTKVLTKSGTAYRLTLMVWDTVARENTPSDPPYVSVVRTFTFAEGATLPITNLTAVQTAAGFPWATINWKRSQSPDSWNVLRDGDPIATQLAPLDLVQPDGSWSYVDKDAAGNVPHTWTVHAVVNGQTSTPNPSVTVTLRSPAVWLTDTASDKVVALLDVSSSSFAQADIAGNYEPVGSDVLVRIVQAQRGLEGSLTGRLTDYVGVTASTWESRLRWMKARPGLELRLTIGAMALRVVIGDVTIAPLQGVLPYDRQVSFSFWSLDGPS